jgi:hypothetical protein
MRVGTHTGQCLGEIGQILADTPDGLVVHPEVIFTRDHSCPQTSHQESQL